MTHARTDARTHMVQIIISRRRAGREIITIRLAFLATLMKLVGIFQDLEHLYDFQTISYGGHFEKQNEAKMLQRQVFITINIPCKFGEDIFINE